MKPDRPFRNANANGHLRKSLRRCSLVGFAALTLLQLFVLLPSFMVSPASADVVPMPLPEEQARLDKIHNAKINESPVVDANDIYFGNIKFYQVDKNTGKVKNKWTLDSPVATTPIVVDNTVYFATERGTVYAIFNGKLLWKVETQQQLTGRPALWNQILCFRAVSRLVAINTQTAELQWWDESADPWFFQNPVAANGNFYDATSWGYVFAINAVTGKKLWETEIAHSETIHQAPIIQDDLVYVYGKETGIVVLDAKTGKKVRAYANLDDANPKSSSYKGTGAFVMDDKFFYATGRSGNDGNFVSAVDRNSGKLAWKYKPEEIPWYLPSLTESLVLIGTGTGSLLALSRTSGRLVWKDVETESDERANTKIPVENGIGFVITRPDIHAIDLSNGKKLWQKSLHYESLHYESLQYGPEPLVNGGVVYRVLLNGTAEAIDLKSGAIKWQLKTEDAVEASLPLRAIRGR